LKLWLISGFAEHFGYDQLLQFLELSEFGDQFTEFTLLPGSQCQWTRLVGGLPTPLRGNWNRILLLCAENLPGIGAGIFENWGTLKRWFLY
jgi:hypothetical protein